MLFEAASTRPEGCGAVPEELVTESAWACIGISLAVSVCARSPPLIPKPEPDVCAPWIGPRCIGTRARRSGSAKVVWPLPP